MVANTSVAVTSDRRAALSARNAKMLELRNQGWSLEAIGEQFPHNGKPMSKYGVSLCVQRAVDEGGVLTVERGKTPGHKNKHTAEFEARKTQALDLFHSGVSIEDIAEQLDTSERTVREYVGEMLPKTPRNAPVKATKTYEEIYEMRERGMAIEDIAEAAGVTPVRVRQVIQKMGQYKPRAATLANIKAVAKHTKNGLSPRKVAEKTHIPLNKVYRYRQMAESMGLL